MTPHFLVVAPRGLTVKEGDKAIKTYSEIGVQELKTSTKSSCFKDNKEVYEVAKAQKPNLLAFFKDRVGEHEKLFNSHLLRDIDADRPSDP